MSQTIPFTNSGEDLFYEPRLRLSKMTFTSKNEEMSGDVILQQPDKEKKYVHVKVYRTLLEHFAVIYPMERLNKPISVINIRNTCITPVNDISNDGTSSITGLIVHQRMFDINTCITLYCDTNNLPNWLKAFTSRNSPTVVHRTTLPIVKEEETCFC